MKRISGKSILIIDDDAAMLRALNKVLTGEGAVVTSACWAGEAMEYLTGKLEQFDLIITDLRMPILGGQTILGAMAVALPDVPVVVITAFGTPELRTQCIHTGAAAFLEKPLDTPQLLAAIESVFSAPKQAQPHSGGCRGGPKTVGSSTEYGQTPSSVTPGALTHHKQ